MTYAILLLDTVHYHHNHWCCKDKHIKYNIEQIEYKVFAFWELEF